MSIRVADELRQLEYSQRLRDRARNVIGADDSRSTGRVLFEGAVRGGAQALGVAGAGIAVGARADFFSLSGDATAFAHRRDDALLDSWIFAGGNDCIDGVWRAGRKLVSSGEHKARDEITHVIEPRFNVCWGVLKRWAAVWSAPRGNRAFPGLCRCDAGWRIPW